MEGIINFVKRYKIITTSLIGVSLFLVFRKFILGFIGHHIIMFSKYYKYLKIILIRHGQSQANVDKSLYSQKPDCQIGLSDLGKSQAFEAGKKLKQLLDPSNRIKFFVSPYQRTKDTYEGLLKSVANQKMQTWVDPRLREQDRGMHNDEERKQLFIDRKAQGHFFFRFPQGEAGADVYDRASQFLDVLYREMDSNKKAESDVVVIVTHSLFMKFFLMRYFFWEIEKFEKTKIAGNCDMWILEKIEGTGNYKLITELKECSEYED